MKKHKVGGSYSIVAVGFFWCVILLFIILVPSSKILNYGVLPISIVPFVLVGSIMLIIGFILIISNLKGAILQSIIIKNGKKGAAQVVCKQYIRSKKGGHHIVEVEYLNEKGEKQISVFSINKYEDYFKEGKVIPVYIWKDYAFYIESEAWNYSYCTMYNMDPDILRDYELSQDEIFKSNDNAKKDSSSYDEVTNYDTKNDSSDIWGDSIINQDAVCSKCGTIVKAGLLYCPNCGESVEANTKRDNEYHGHNNYCPECGAKVDNADKFCRECGYRLK